MDAGFKQSWVEVMYAMGEYPATNPERERWVKIVSMANGATEATHAL